MNMQTKPMDMDQGKSHYRLLLIMTLFSFVSMYVLMYSMVDSASNIFSSFNQVYMAGLMTAPMVIIELLLMKGMYTDSRRNVVILALSALAGIGFFALIRQQSGVGDRQFLRSMIPHHAGAILMCEKASLEDAAVKTLCGEIVRGQRAEIAQMKRLLDQR